MGESVKRGLLAYIEGGPRKTTNFAEMLAKRKVSPMVDAYYVYRVAVYGDESSAPEGQRPYLDPNAFLSVTYITPAVRQYSEDFLRRLSRGEPGVYLMSACLGAGKSHFLALLIHLLALYRRCGGSGACVRKELERHGIELETPDIPKLPEIYMLHGEHKLGEKEEELRRARTKEELARLLATPFVAVLDEVQHFEDREQDFPLWLQMLTEVAIERSGVVVVSLPTTGGARYKTVDVVERANPVKVVLDSVDSIVKIFRRWAGIRPQIVDLPPLKGAVGEELYAGFSRKVEETYPFNPYLVDILIGLAKLPESGVQLARGLLWALTHAYMRAVEEGAKLATFRHLPEPGDLLVIGGSAAAEWQELLRAYEDDLRRVKDHSAALSVLRHVLLASLLARLRESGSYPTYADVVLGTYDGAVKPSDVATVLVKVPELRVLRLGGDRYAYLPIIDVYGALAEAMKQYGESDGVDAAAEALLEMLRERAKHFDAVYVSGYDPRGGRGQYGKVRIIPSKEEWEKALRKSENVAVLAADFLNFGAPVRRSNLAYMRRNDSAPPPPSKVLQRLGIEVATARDAAINLGRAVRAAEAVLESPATYFGKSQLGPETEEPLRRKVAEVLALAKSELANAVSAWLGRVLAGHEERAVKSLRDLDDLLVDWARAKELALGTTLRRLVEEMQGRFVKVGDLWSMYLNRRDVPYAPVSFPQFAETLSKYCSNCNCLFEAGGAIKWIGERGCETPLIDADTAVAPAVVGGRLNTEAIERFLRQLTSDGKVRYAVVYRAPGGGEISKYADELLAEPEEWLRLLQGARLRAERSRRAAIRIDGEIAAKVVKQPGSHVAVKVDADGLEVVEYELGGASGSVAAEGGQAEFAVEVPGEPGAYALRLTLRFSGGGVEQRVVAVVVEGGCAVEPAVEVPARGVIRWIRTNSVADATYFFDNLAEAGVTLALKASWQNGASRIEVNAVLGAKDRDYAIRLLKLLEMMRAQAYAEFKFESLKVDERVAAVLRGRSAEYGVERCRRPT